MVEVALEEEVEVEVVKAHAGADARVRKEVVVTTAWVAGTA